jgi:hypothetical protein
MGRKANLSGIRVQGSNRIQFDFEFEGVRYRPSLERIPNEANLRRAHQQLADIKKRIGRGEFNFADEFPDYRFKAALPTANYIEVSIKPETCNEVVDRFIAYCELRVSKDDMAASTLGDYKEVLDRVVRPAIGSDLFKGVIYSRLAAIVAANTKNVKKKTYNNIVSVVRTYFKFG